MNDYYEMRNRDLEHEVGTLTSKLALANRALEEANQSITELHAQLSQCDQWISNHMTRATRIAQLESEVSEQTQQILADLERIAQLEATLREIIDTSNISGPEAVEIALEAQVESHNKVAAAAATLMNGQQQRIAHLEAVMRDLRTSIKSCRLYLGERGAMHYENWLSAIDTALEGKE